jgi:hypothetical protein
MHTDQARGGKVRGYHQFDANKRSREGRHKRMENPRIVPQVSPLRGRQKRLRHGSRVYGLGEINRNTLETLMRYSQEQGLLGRKMAVEELFINTVAHS